MGLIIYHNPECSKSRRTLQLLREAGHEPQVIEYLKSPPDETTLAELLQKLGLSAVELMRTGETEYKAARDSVEAMSEEEKITWLATNPRVLQRPIVVSGRQARIGRPPESALEILS